MQGRLFVLTAHRMPERLSTESFAPLKFAGRPIHLSAAVVRVAVGVVLRWGLDHAPDLGLVGALWVFQTEQYLFFERPFLRLLITPEDGLQDGVL